MARDCYETTVAVPDATGVLKALSNVNVYVVPRGMQDLANIVDIFTADTGVTKGPDPRAGATGTNPFLTGVTGSVRFWAEGPAELDIVFVDAATPARISDRVGWNAVPAKAGSTPTRFLALDGGITQAMLSADVISQQTPIGGVIEWWRPASTPVIPPPSGYEIADGHTVSQHEFPGVSGSVALPNLQNCFILGATLGKLDGAGAGPDDLAASAPGIRGAGGTNAPFDITHSHGVPGVDHSHAAGSLYAASHQHGGGTLYVNGHNRTFKPVYGTGSQEAAAFAASISNVAGGVTDLSGNLGVGGSTGGVNSGAAAINTGTNSTAWTKAWPGAGGPAAIDFRPHFYGLLRLIKVRRTA